MEELLNFYICLSTQLLIFSGFEGNLFWSLPLIVFLFSFLQVYHHALLLAASHFSYRVRKIVNKFDEVSSVLL